MQAPQPAIRPTPAVLACALGLALLASSCGLLGAGGRRGFQMPPVPVEVADARPQTVRDQFHALGGIEADENIRVVSEINAVVRELPFAEGQPVAVGALIAQLDDREIRAEAQRAEAQHDQAQSNFARAQKLMEQSAISPQDLEDARTALRVAEADEALAKARLDKTRIRAAFAGLVGRRRVSPGAYLQAGDIITELARVDEMKVTFAAPERYAGRIRPGSPVDVTAPAFPDRRFTGRVTVVDPIVDPRSRTIQVVARIGNPGRLLRPGMSGDVSVTFAERDKAIAVPDEAVFAEGNQSFVYRVEPDSTVARVPVELGTRDSMRVEIVSGLAPGDRVVRAGHQKLFPGAHVVPILAQAAKDLQAGDGGGAAGAPRGASPARSAGPSAARR